MSSVCSVDLETSVWQEFDVPAAFVHEVVVFVAEWDEVVEVGWSAVVPFPDVVCLTPPGPDGAALETTGVVDGVECSPLGGGSGPVCAANVYRYAAFV